MVLDLGNTSLERNLRLKSLGCLHFMPAIFCICCLDTPCITFGYYWGNSLTHLVLTTAFEVSIFGPKATRRSWVSTPNWVPIWLWSQWYNPLSHSPNLLKKFSPDLHPDFPKCGIAPNTQSSYSLRLWWPSGLLNTSLDTKFNVQNLFITIVNSFPSNV